MKRIEADEWIRNHDMPHEHFMDRRGIEFSDLNASIQADIRNYDEVYQEALNDGYIDEEEEKELITISYKIAEQIREQFGEPSKGGGGLMGIFAGIGIAVATVFGINQIRNS